MIDPIWKQAPEGTTHRHLSEPRLEYCWRKVVDGEIYYWSANASQWCWLISVENSDLDEKYQARPEEPEPVAPNLLRIPADIVPPPGATRVALVWYSTVDGQAVVHQPNPEQGAIELVGEQPAPEWDGVGIPPVGTVCEWLVGSNFRWERVEILGRHRQFTWIRKLETEVLEVIGHISNLRPILTEAQQAAKARKEDIDEICRDVQAALEPYNANIDCSVAMRATIEALYDRGYFNGDEE